METRRTSEDRVGVVLGVLLLLAGLAALIAQATSFEMPEDSWPFVIIVPGLALLISGLLLRGDAGTGLTVAGSVVTTVGAILLYQNTTETWESWAYAWALVGPTAPGVGILLSGLVNGNGKMVRDGGRMALVGLTVFAIGYVFFELVIGIGSDQPRDVAPWVLPASLVILGAAIVGRALLFPHRGEETTSAASAVVPTSAPDEPGTTGTSV